MINCKGDRKVQVRVTVRLGQLNWSMTMWIVNSEKIDNGIESCAVNIASVAKYARQDQPMNIQCPTFGNGDMRVFVVAWVAMLKMTGQATRVHVSAVVQQVSNRFW